MRDVEEVAWASFGGVCVARVVESTPLRILTRNAGFALSDWRTHNQLLIERNAFMDRKKATREEAGAYGANPLPYPPPNAPP